jgi:protein-S-isoprenylcysteine O-methyltransferase Ste14
MAKESDRPNTSPIVHPPVVTLAFLLIAYALGRFVTIPLTVPAMLRYIGLALASVGFLFGVGAFIEFVKARTTLDPHSAAKHLVTSGIYRFTRNPIYLGFLLVVIGLPLYFGLYWGIVLAPLYVFLMNRLIIQHEEAYLERKFGKTYTDYTSQVRRWL